VTKRLRNKSEKQHLSITRASKIVKYLGLTLAKPVKDLYDKNFKTLKEEIEEDIR
jgi:ribosomal protein S13